MGNDQAHALQTSILVVDDTRSNLRLLAEILTDRGYVIRLAPSGSLALSSAHTKPPDLILLDIMMPGISGYEVCKQLKADEQTCNIPIIFISGLHEVFDKVKAFALGGVDYITKPFQAEEVIARIETHLTLRNLQKSLQEKNSQLQREITEREKAEEALQRAHDKLEIRVKERTTELRLSNAQLAKALRLKNEFLAMMSHEFRTPLNTVLGLSEALRLNVYGELNEKQQNTLKTIEKSGWHLFEMINNILELIEISTDGLPLQYNILDVELVCRASIKLIKQAASKKHLNVSLAFRNTITIHADECRLKQILVNLLNNAVKFTPEGGKIGLEVEADSEQQFISFCVWDTGIGIAKDDMARLFQPFTQLDSSLARQYEGTGLGLSLVYYLVNMHGGNISVKSEVGKGSRFTVSLPCKPPGMPSQTGDSEA